MVHTFSKGISLTMNVIAQLEFKLTMMLQSSMLATMLQLPLPNETLTSTTILSQSGPGSKSN